MAVADAVPEIAVDAEHTVPVSVAWLIVSVPDIVAPTVKLSTPDGPLAADQLPLALVPLCVSVAVTVSVTVVPDVENIHVPVHVPVTLKPDAAGAVGELPHPAGNKAIAHNTNVTETRALIT
jgi:hypothetical protein